MIIDMPNTRTREIAHKIEQLHEERGESATGRVLTLLIATEDADLEHALEIANSASREPVSYTHLTLPTILRV